MASVESDRERKEFSPPSQGTAGLYIYRNSALGGALKKSIYVDGQFVGETGPMTYFYKEVQPGPRVISTESEFSNNDITLDAKSGKNHFIKQYIKIGLFVGGANLEIVSEEEGKKGVLQCKLANSFDNVSLTYPSETEESITEQALEPGQPASQYDVSGTYNLTGTYRSAITSSSSYVLGKRKYKNLTFELKQDGDKISGKSLEENIEISGILNDNTVKFEIAPVQATGNWGLRGTWKISPDGRQLTGRWSQPKLEARGKWNLERLK